MDVTPAEAVVPSTLPGALKSVLGASALGVGGMVAIMMGPSLLVQPHCGSVVDRVQGKRVLVITSLMMALLAGSFMLQAAFLSIWLLYAITLAAGIVQTFDMLALEIRLMLLTPRDLRGTANAVQMLSITAGGIVVPVIGGIVQSWPSPVSTPSSFCRRSCCWSLCVS